MTNFLRSRRISFHSTAITTNSSLSHLLRLLYIFKGRSFCTNWHLTSIGWWRSSPMGLYHDVYLLMLKGLLICWFYNYYLLLIFIVNPRRHLKPLLVASFFLSLSLLNLFLCDPLCYPPYASFVFLIPFIPLPSPTPSSPLSLYLNNK